MAFDVGSKVVFLTESGGGIITQISGIACVVQDDDGFNHECTINDVAPVVGEEMPIHDPAFLEKDFPEKVKRKTTRSGRLRKIQTLEIDLHIEELVDDHFGLTNTEILTIQMRAFKRFYEKARLKKVNRIIAIHGVGEGVLRYEIRVFLNNESGVEYCDADYREYGQGATEIDLKYNY